MKRGPGLRQNPRPMSYDSDTKADSIELITDPQEKAVRETENGIRQFNAALKMIGDHILNPDRPFRLKNAIILDLHKAALDGIHPQAGTYRNIGVTIGQSGHSRHGRVKSLIM